MGDMQLPNSIDNRHVSARCLNYLLSEGPLLRVLVKAS